MRTAPTLSKLLFNYKCVRPMGLNLSAMQPLLVFSTTNISVRHVPLSTP